MPNKSVDNLERIRYRRRLGAAVRDAYAAGSSYRELMRLYGLSYGTVWNMVHPSLNIDTLSPEEYDAEPIWAHHIIRR